MDHHGRPHRFHLGLSSRAAPQAPPDPDHFADQDVGEGRGFDRDGARGIRRLVRVVGAEAEGVAGEVDPREGTAVPPG